MRRREFIALVGGAVAWPRGELGRKEKKFRELVFLARRERRRRGRLSGAFIEGLGSFGYVDGKTIALEQRFPNEMPERFKSMAAELVALNPDVLVAVTRPAAAAAQVATTTIPTVFLVVPDPVGTKMIQSLARPGGNITGLTQIAVELTAKRLGLFKEEFPHASRVALLLNANDQLGMQRYSEEFRVAAVTLGMRFEPVEVRSLSDLSAPSTRSLRRASKASCLPADGLFYQGRTQLAQLK